MPHPAFEGARRRDQADRLAPIPAISDPAATIAAPPQNTGGKGALSSTDANSADINGVALAARPSTWMFPRSMPMFHSR